MKGLGTASLHQITYYDRHQRDGDFSMMHQDPGYSLWGT